MVMATILINGLLPFEQIFTTPLTEGSMWNLEKIGPGISEEKSFKGVNGQTDNRQTEGGMASDHNSSSWAFG